jgi:hypothetical protein
VTQSADTRPARVYLARLGEGSRRAQKAALNLIASQLTGRVCDLDSMPWERLRYQHTAALRRWLIERYAAVTANRYLAALRGVLREAWRLELVDAESYQRAVDLEAAIATGSPAPATLPCSPSATGPGSAGRDRPTGRR